MSVEQRQRSPGLFIARDGLAHLLPLVTRSPLDLFLYLAQITGILGLRLVPESAAGHLDNVADSTCFLDALPEALSGPCLDTVLGRSSAAEPPASDHGRKKTTDEDGVNSQDPDVILALDDP